MKSVMRKIVSMKRSLANRWTLRLSCGHYIRILSENHPARERAACDHCTAERQAMQAPAANHSHE